MHGLRCCSAVALYSRPMTCQNPSRGRPITEPLVQDPKLGIAKAVLNRNNQCQVLKHNLSTALLIARDGHS
jgi:hypothetical protein